MTDCVSLIEQQEYYLEKMEEGRAAVVRAHLADCEVCREVYTKLLEDIGVTGKAGVVSENGTNTLPQTEEAGSLPEQGPHLRVHNQEEPPPQIPDFEMHRRLGVGAFGEVWMARSKTDVYRAIKVVFKGHHTNVEFDGIRTYQTYSRGHPNLIDVLHVGETANHFYYIMELADGYATAPTFSPRDYEPRTLRGDLMRNGRFPLPQACRTLLQILAGLDHLHRHELLHRDVKPANVVFVNGEAALADIGLLTKEHDQRTGGLTPAYSPPQGVIDRSGDLYCAGKVLFELATGTSAAKFPQVPTIADSDYREGIAHLLPILDRACALDPARRYQSAAEMAAELEALMADLAATHNRTTSVGSELAKPATVTVTQGAHLLVVDDNENNRDMLSRRLQRCGYEVSLAEDGAAALDCVNAERFDLVLLDVMMPGIDGFEVLKTLREKHAPTELPVIMATAKDQREDIVEAFKLGANDYVTKPLDFPVVLARVGTQLSLKRAVDQILELERNLERQNQELEQANRCMSRDLRSAALVQQALLPSSAPNIAGVEFRWAYRPCDELAGDILNVFTLDESHVALYLLDVSGHGVPAALLSVALSRILVPVPGQPSLVQRRREGSDALEIAPPAEVAEELNRRFQMDTQAGQYFTLFYGVLDTTTGELAFVSAGHPGPVYIPYDVEPRILENPAFAIGWFPEADYAERSLVLNPGDRILIHSDGVNEALSPAGEQFGQGRILALLEACSGISLEETLARMVREAEIWSGGPFDDDVSALAIERHHCAP